MTNVSSMYYVNQSARHLMRIQFMERASK